ncbi:MAG TPA: SpoIID/LytB domain-containing protein [Gaiellaceae bacterium]|nr:SpoIID/LytB domain-containing protein [Gaiellaceae bacterium]
MRRCGLIAVLALLTAAPAGAATKVVIAGHGWGHGVGMSQWGAYGFARHGWRYDRILAHYYPGTRLAQAPVSRVRVLLATGQPRAAVACAAPMRVSDATGRSWSLPRRSYVVNASLKLVVGTKRVRVDGKRHAHHESYAQVPVRHMLRSPAVFDCPGAPLTWNGRAYHGLLVVRAGAARVSVVNSLALDDYVRGVVAGEMPHTWSLAALEAQAVASRSYALATLHPSKHFDLFSDTRSQVYGGIAYETPQTNFAVQRTAGKVLTWNGRVATTFFFSTSGGRTANVADVWPALGAVPYLRSVADPYDGASPHHSWQVVVPAAKLPADGALSLERAKDGRVTAIVAGGKRIDPNAFRQRLGLQSTWFDVGTLTLDAGSPRVRFGGKLTLSASVRGLGPARLERRIGAGRWKQLATVGGARTVTVEPRANTLYRLTAGAVTGPVVGVDVAPRLSVTPAGADELAGTIEPATDGAVTVLRRVDGAWKLVARPQVAGDGTFRTPLRLHRGDYRVQVADDGRYASASADVHVTSRLLASLGY